jgi:hypothetical protein
MKLVCLALGGLLCPALARAQAAPDSAPTQPPLTWYGFVDAYYGYDIRHADTNERPGFLYSHNRQNEFSINNAVLGLRYDDDRVRGALALHAGSYVAANYRYEDPALRHIYEAYAGFRPFAKAWLDAGIFSSHIGMESALSKDNWTLTRSLAAENSPYYETGVRFTYEAGPKLTLAAVVLNGWQNIRENNQNKALGTQLQWKPTPRLLVNSSTFFGNEQFGPQPRRRRYFHDLYATYAATDQLSLGLVFDLGLQQAARAGRYDTWHGGVALLRYRLAEKWTAVGRAEYYYARHGVIVSAAAPRPADPDFNVKAASLGLDYAPRPNIVCRVEGRFFKSPYSFLTDRASLPSDNYGNLTSSIALSF